jgi:hypothetical protein
MINIIDRITHRPRKKCEFHARCQDYVPAKPEPWMKSQNHCANCQIEMEFTRMASGASEEIS